MITILEGPDCAGKSTLAQALVALDPTNMYTHFGPPPARVQATGSPAFEQYLTWLANEFWPFRDLHHVVDRFCYGELVYGPIYRNDRTFEPWMIRMIERVLLTMDPLLVMCLPMWDVVEKLWQSRKNQEMLKSVDQLQQVYRAYVELGRPPALYPRIPMVLYDYTRNPTIREVRDLSLKHRYRCSRPNLGPGIGSFHAGAILMVGERVNPKIDINGWPFVATTGSSVWLTQQLEEAGVTEDSLYWINAFEPAGHRTPAHFVERLDPSKIILFGKQAQDWATKASLRDMYECHNVPHPAFWKRFHARDPYNPLLEALYATR